MSDHEHNSEDLELTRPELRRFIEAARNQPIVGTCVTAESVQAGLEHSRRRTQNRRLLALSGSIAVAASMVAAGVLWPMLSAKERANERDATAARDPEIIDSGVAARDPEIIDSGVAARDPEIIDSGARLASAVRLRSTSSVEVRDPWSIALGEGTHEIEIDRQNASGRALGIALPGRTLELVEGSATIVVEGPSAAVRLHTGVAAWVGENGERTRIQVERLTPEGPKSNKSGAQPSSAAALAREAEELLAAGDRGQAIATLRRLVETYPNASQTRPALLDLARLLKSSGREKQARCAYELYLDRWPNTSVTAEVESSLERLRKAKCSGLDPK
jgi:hypothetical protein